MLMTNGLDVKLPTCYRDVVGKISANIMYFSADWHNLLFANYTIDPKVLTSLGPAGTKLSFHNGSCYISLISCHFLYTQVFGIQSGSRGTHRTELIFPTQ